MASRTQEDIATARGPDQVVYWQIYAMRDLRKTEREIKNAVKLGFKGFALTVDAIRAGKRERDLRAALLEEAEDDDDLADSDGEAGLSGSPTVTRGMMWEEFDWESALKWLRKQTDLPICIKGIQSWQDAKLCAEYVVIPWLSNHAGRQLDGAPSAVETLLDMQRFCPGVFERSEVIVDGGIRRGTDILKAFALGATSVGLGRPFIYALALGERGISRTIQILRQEIETGMSLLGVNKLSELNRLYDEGIVSGIWHIAILEGEQKESGRQCKSIAHVEIMECKARQCFTGQKER
ncbi:uncharacterized protein A1O9_09902 [Exophiala aquamarina CBS 119918]|uniref:FMN hydroxy acid dehydrogenase domain-containing protein n=1 Tax=Exophiala aquamarina CBS 119918 TaxID=1182545 RepID=A0A072P327_9EURO|nr:uncharacterized protein A1O9_09902 [Exophiala aquamarina CBS 119918]KEF54107.1 hypothetical protein A1O9_09902 [Exophiala aquamarina CBS 119918]